MLYSRFSLILFTGHLFMFITMPFTSYQHQALANGEDTDSLTYTVPEAQKVELNKNAVKFVRKYLKENNEELVKIRERSDKPFKTIETVFRKYGLPVQLKYLAVIESELKPTAVSRVGAVGPWQFMPGTARVLGLKVAGHYDERRLYGKSTRAAAIYLRDLYSEFGDWLLVTAAYNCGPAPVYAAMRRSRSKNFWKLQGFLPAESRDHVKKFIATHYFFEGNGGETTLTRAENILNSQRQLMMDGDNDKTARYAGLAYGFQ